MQKRRQALYTNIGRQGHIEPESPSYLFVERCWVADFHHILDGAIEMELATTIAYVGLLAMRRAGEAPNMHGASIYDSVWRRASDYLAGQQG